MPKILGGTPLTAAARVLRGGDGGRAPGLAGCGGGTRSAVAALGGEGHEAVANLLERLLAVLFVRTTPRPTAGGLAAAGTHHASALLREVPPHRVGDPLLRPTTTPQPYVVTGTRVIQSSERHHTAH